MIVLSTPVPVNTKFSITQQDVSGSNPFMSTHILGIVQGEIYAFIKTHSTGDIFIQVQQQRIHINSLFDL